CVVVLSANYRAPLGGGNWEWLGRVGLRYASKEYLHDDAMNIAYLPAYTIFNGSLTFRNENLTISLFGNNLTDDDTPRGVSLGTDNNLTPVRDGYAIMPRIPRELGARLIYQF
ncbi:MAG TPA: TonB-dependent receptor, partial [Gammaproteobacteria bacterium]|nr:TonB-dependent receptor [Gammaproteobacteria bacterium]